MDRFFYSRAASFCLSLTAVLILVGSCYLVMSRQKSKPSLSDQSAHASDSSHSASDKHYPTNLLKKSDNISFTTFTPPPLPQITQQPESALATQKNILSLQKLPEIKPLPAPPKEEKLKSVLVLRELPDVEEHTKSALDGFEKTGPLPRPSDLDSPLESRDAPKDSLAIDSSKLKRLPIADHAEKQLGIERVPKAETDESISSHDIFSHEMTRLPDAESSENSPEFTPTFTQPKYDNHEMISQDENSTFNPTPEIPTPNSYRFDNSQSHENFPQPVESTRGLDLDPPSTLVHLPAVENELKVQRTSQNPQLDDAAMGAVSQRVNALNQHAFILASRGAYYSARAELIQALRLMAQALDAKDGTRIHSRALSQGFLALSEADDFIPKGADLEADLDLNHLINSHRTPILKGLDNSELIPLVALQRYYTFAQEQLALAGQSQSAASTALYGLARLQSEMIAGVVDSKKIGGPKAMTLHQAALLVDSNNYQAANELGVLLARYGQYQESQKVLAHSISISPQPQTWHNLAVVHEHLGEHDLARRAQHEMQLAAAKIRKTPRNSQEYDGSLIRWIDNDKFANQSSSPELHLRSRQPTQIRSKQPPAAKKQKTAQWIPWLKRQG